MILLHLIASLSLGTPALAISVSGNVEIRHEGNTTALVRFADVPEGAWIITHKRSRATLRLASGSELALGPDTQIAMSQMQHDTKVPSRRQERVKIITGRIWANVMSLFGQESKFEIEAHNAVAGVRGTSFWVSAGADGSSDFVLEHGALDIVVGEERVAINTPGARFSRSGNGQGSHLQLTPGQMRRFRQASGGAGAALRSLLTPNVPGGIAGLGDGNQAMRSIMMGPGGVSDTSVVEFDGSDGITGGSGGGIVQPSPADVTIQVKLP